jgi:hypothetical protein
MKEYPAFIIDRSRRSAASRFTDDFIVCTDKEVGFIARAYKVPKSRREEFVRVWLADEERYLPKVIGESVIVLEVERFLYEPVAHRNRIKPLLKKAMKAYLYGEVEAVAGGGTPFDMQEAAILDVVRLAESQRSRLEDMNGASATDVFIKQLRDAADSIALLKKIVKNE